MSDQLIELPGGLEITVPAQIHYAVLETTTPNGITHTRHLVWVNRTSPHCPNCKMWIGTEVDSPPAGWDLTTLPPRVVDLGLMLPCQCGTVDPAAWESTTDPADVKEIARRLVAERAQEIFAWENRRELRLARELAAVLAELKKGPNEGEDEEEFEKRISTGDAEHPGVYRETDGEWISWDYDPTDDPDSDGTYDDPLTVRVSDLDRLLPDPR